MQDSYLIYFSLIQMNIVFKMFAGIKEILYMIYLTKSVKINSQDFRRSVAIIDCSSKVLSNLGEAFISYTDYLAGMCSRKR